MALFSPVVENFKKGYVFFFCMWIKNYIQCFTERYRKNNGWCAKSVACLRYLPPKHCHCNQKIAKIVMPCWGHVPLYFWSQKFNYYLHMCWSCCIFYSIFLQNTVCQCTKKDTKKTTQKIEILIDIFKKSFNPAYVELELVPFYFWVFEKNPFSKKT